MSPPKSQPLAKPVAAVKGRRTRIATAILVTWALVASIAFGWTWVADQRVEQQQRESIRATINRIVWDLSSEFFAASASTQALLMTRSLHYGWIGAVWLDDVQDRVTDLFVTTEGMTVVQALNMTVGVSECSSEAYQQILTHAASDPSVLNGTNQYTAYFGVAENLAFSLGWNFGNISGSGNNPLDQLGSSSASAIRAELASLFATSRNYGGVAC